MEELLNLLINYSKQGKIIDENVMRKIVAIMIDIKNLNNYVSKFELSSSIGRTAAVYLSEEKTIKVYASLVDFILNRNKKFIPLFKTEEIILFYNLLIVQILLHELEHANQCKIIDEDDNVEAFVLRASYTVSKDVALALYEIMPNERLAEIKSFSELTEIIELIRKNIPNIYSFISTSKLEKDLRGYHYINGKVSSPLLVFLKESNIKASQYFNLVDGSYFKALELIPSNYLLSSRMKYGFPITSTEYKEEARKVILSKKYKKL